MKTLQLLALALLCHPAFAQPTANAGTDQTIYLSQTSTATLDGSGSSGTSFLWTEISTDYMSGGTISSPDSKITTVNNLPQGVFYFEIAATTGGITKRDSMKVIVDYAPAPANSSLIAQFSLDQTSNIINNRFDTVTYFQNESYPHNQIAVNGIDYGLIRDRLNGLMIDSLRGKLYSIIQDGYVSSDNYARAEIEIPNPSITIDTSKTYIVEWKGYYPNETNYITGDNNDILTMFQMHGDLNPNPFGMLLDGNGNISVTDYANDHYNYSPVSKFSFFVNNCHTIRMTLKEGLGHDNQKNFLKIDIDGQRAYLRDTGTIGLNTFQDYLKFGSLYDFGSHMVNGDSLARGRKFQLVTTSYRVYTLKNIPIVVKAGNDTSMILPTNSVTVSGIATPGDGSVVSYKWKKVSGGSAIITSPTTANTSITGLTQGTYVFNFKAVDSNGYSDSDNVSVIVNPSNPVISATGYNTDVLVDPVTNSNVSNLRTGNLDGSGFCFYVQGFSTNSVPLNYGLPANGEVVSPTGIFYQMQPYNQNNALKINPGNKGTLALSNPSKFDKINLMLTSGATNVNYTINYSDGSTDNGSIRCPDWGCVYCSNFAVANLGRTDDGGSDGLYYWKIYEDAISTDSNKIINSITFSPTDSWVAVFALSSTPNAAPNIPPTANAGADQAITLPTNSISLNGTGTDTDGSIASYQWTKITGTGGTITNATKATATVSNLTAGTYQYELTVTDNQGAVAKDTVKITANSAPNIPPTANAGADQTITLPTNRISLNGTGTDTDGSIASYQWTKIAGADGTITNATKATATVTNLTTGTYQYELAVTDNKGAVAKDTVTITVNAAPNIPPTANAGADQAITLPTNSISLNGTGTDTDGSIASYQWTKITGTGGTITNATKATATVSNLTAGTYQYELTVTDNQGAVAKDTVKITVNAAANIPPTANAGADQTITLPTNSISLNGIGTDTDGSIASYQWTKITGTGGTITNATKATATVSNLTAGTYQYELAVTDNKGAVAKDTVTITVNAAPNIPPTANAGADQTITLPTNRISLNGTGTDTDGSIASYQWTKIAGADGTITNATKATATVTNLTTGTYQYELAVTDNKGAVAKDTVTITVNAAPNIPPTANAGADQAITLPTNSISLNGTGTDTDGSIASYQWTKITGTGGTITNATKATATVSNLTAGTYQYELTVTDNQGAVAKDTVKITVNAAANIPPTANAGADQTITLPTNSISLNGIGTDTDGSIASYQWTKISGTGGTITNSTKATATASNLTAGTYQYELAVTDNKGAVAKDTVKVTVNAAANIPPTANAGADQAITLPTNSISLNGTGTDTDGSIASYQWTKIAGADGTITNATKATATVTNLTTGTYQYELAVTDNKGAVAKDTVTITVNAAPNIPPTANAGADQAITLPTNSISLNGTGTDTDGSIASYQWTKITGTGGTITNATKATATVSNLTAGTYQYELTVTDNQGAVAKDTVKITVNAAANIPPTANAGADQTITLPTNSISLNGIGTDTDGSIASYQWTKISGTGGTITNATKATATVTNLTAGTYQYELAVTDNKGAVAKDTVTITVNAAPNIPPTANAGADQAITLPTNSISLNGTGTDTDGSIASYQWTKITGTGGTITNATKATATVSNLTAGTYQYELTVTDNQGAVAKDTVKITVNAAANIPPTANAGADQTITLPTNSISLNGIGTDTDGSIASYQWTKISGTGGTITNATKATATVTNLTAGIYQYELTVTDNQGAVAKDTVKITANSAPNIPPTANAGADQTITLPTNRISLNGTGTDTDGSIASYQWTKIAGADGTITNATKATATVTNLTTGTYQYELAVTDNKGAVAKDTVTITVNAAPNIPPTANAGADQAITLPTNSISLNGTGTDTDGSIASYQWTKITGTGGTITNATKATATVSNLTAGTYQYELTVTDNQGAVAKDTVKITVNAAANIPPTANAGADQTITLPTNSISLNGIGTDTDGSIASYQWTKISGTGGTITNSTKATATASNLTAGTYQYELAVTDNKGAVAKDTVKVTVNAAANIPPTANAGADQAITLPTNSISLNGTGTDTDGSIASYQWTKIAGADGTITNATKATATVTNLTTGTYQYELAVTDNKGAVAKDTVTITVNAAPNIPPTANAGADQAITLPTNSISLNGTGTDTDGSIASYQWTKITGTGGTITNATKATATVSNLTAGTYQYELTVTDNQGAVAKDTVKITVNAAANIPPTANAGADQTITLPTNSISLNGIGTDTDGSIASYQWTKIKGTGGTITNATKATATASNLTVGTYRYELAVIDNQRAVAKDTVTITVNAAANIPPTANAGADQMITLPTNRISLNGTGTDTDGSIVSYQWTKVSGADGSITNATKATATVTNLTAGTYQYELAVTDNQAAVAKDTVKITVNAAANIPPTANAGVDQTITLPTNSISLNGTGTDIDGSIASYQWTKISGTGGTITNNTKATSTASNLTTGTYQYELAVTDNKGAVAKDTVTITVNAAPNIPPTANAGADQAITLPTNSISLNGTGTDTDGSIASYQWTKITGTGGTITNATKATATVSNLTAGTYQYELTVTDNQGAVAKDTVKITVNAAPNIPPTANAGADQTITLPANSISLNGTGTDTDGSIASYQWTKITGADGTITNATKATATVSNLTAGTYQYELAVTDNKGAVAKDTVTITVNAAPNIPPTANAGADQTITLPTNRISLNGTGTDTDGSIASYQWTKIAGAGGTITNATKATATVSNLTAGTYQYELTVTDNKGAVAKDTVKLTVNAAPNIPPTANAGNDQIITLPTNSVTLSGSGKDSDGTITSFQWTKISGPDSEPINNGNYSFATINNLSEGTYQFELTVKDNEGGIGKDTMQVIVNAAVNNPLTVNAGRDTTILYPASTVILNGKGNDSTGEIASYNWKQVSGPSESIINSGDTPTAEISELKEGTYEYEFLVTDNNENVGRDTVKVTVASGRLATEINSSITVYPNPVHDLTTADINTERPNTNVLVTITDMSGKTVYKKQMVSATDNVKEQINMSNLSKGTYVITIFFDDVLKKSIKVLKL